MDNALETAVLTSGNLKFLVLMLVLVIIVTGLAVLIRAKLDKREADQSIVRSWIALMLVGGLLMLAAFSFALDDNDLRNLILGGVVASAGSAIAFYFSSKSSEGARKDILDATFGLSVVPDLENKTPAAAKESVADTAFSLRSDSATPPAADALVTKQQPPPGTQARRGSEIVVTYGAP